MEEMDCGTNHSPLISRMLCAQRKATMKTKAFANFALIALSGVAQGTPLGTAIMYQGRLTEQGNAVNGLYDLRFALFDAPTEGTAASGVLTNAATVVSNGLFSVSIDFGAGVFNGTERWLEIGVRTNGAGSDFVVLNPRQSLTPTVYALHALSAGIAHGVTSNSLVGSSLQDGAVTLSKIASGQVVKSLNGLRDDLVLEAGTNITLFTNGNTFRIAAATGVKAGALPINVLDFGAIADYREDSNTGSDNRAAFANAVTAAISSKRTLYIPAGTYLLDLEGSHNYLDVTGDLRVIGDGKGRTNLKVTKSGQSRQRTNELAAVRIRPGVAYCEENLTWDGPNQGPESAQFSVNWMTDARCTVVLRNVATSKFRVPFWAQMPTNSDTFCILEAEACDFRGYGEALVFQSTDAFGGEFRFRNCSFHNENDSGTVITNPTGHCIYTTYEVAVFADGCRFNYAHGPDDGKDAAYAIHPSGGTTNAPKYFTIQNCYFNDVEFGVLGNPNAPTIIDGCTFDLLPRRSNTAIRPRRGPTMVSNCSFRGGGEGCVLELEPGDLQMTHCRIEGAWTGGAIVYSHPSATPRWSIIDCDIANSANNALWAYKSGRFEVRQNRFGDSSPNAIFERGGSWDISNNIFEDVVEIVPDTEAMAVVFNGNRFRTGRLQCANPQQVVTLEGENNRFDNADLPFLDGTNLIGRLTPPGGVNPTPIPAASAIYLSPNFAIHKIIGTGAETVVTIDVSDPARPSKKGFSGPFYLQGTRAPWVLSSNGNVKPIGNAPRLIQVGETITVVYDTAEATWHEIGSRP